MLVGEAATNQFASGTDDECAEAVLRAPPFAQEDLEDGDEESERLAAAGASCAEDVLALEREGQGALLDVGHAAVVGRLEAREGLAREREVAELDGLIGGLCAGSTQVSANALRCAEQDQRAAAHLERVDELLESVELVAVARLLVVARALLGLSLCPV